MLPAIAEINRRVTVRGIASTGFNYRGRGDPIIGESLCA